VYSPLRLVDGPKTEALPGIVRLDRRGRSTPPPLPPVRAKTLPVRRLAAFLMTLSRMNSYEGRDPHFIADDLTCGFVKEALSLDIEALKTALTQLSAMGLISACANGGLRIDDLEGLERFCD
jgi:CRP/FNR family transcriptional regulator